jgi:hypothetical protein
MMPKPQTGNTARLEGVRALTICAAFTCRDGLTLCADTEETHGDMKFQAPKLVALPRSREACTRKAIFAGAGDGPFIDKLIEQMWSAGQFADVGIQAMSNAMEDECIRVHERYWRIYPADARPEAHVIFGLAEGGETRLYKATGCIINPVATYELTGCGDPLARYIAERIEENPSVRQAVSLCVYLLAETKTHVSGCGGASHVVTLNRDGSHIVVPDDRINSMCLTFSSVEREMFRLMYSLTDHEEVSEVQFESALAGAMRFFRGLRTADAQLMPLMNEMARAATSSIWEPQPVTQSACQGSEGEAK